jgi:hypothetical protein
VIQVKIADERLDELDQAAQEALANGSFYVRVSAPELAVMVARCREQQQQQPA